MDARSIFPFVILLISVGLIVGIGVTLLDSFAGATEASQTTNNESASLATGTVQLSYNDMTALNKVHNATHICTSLTRDFSWTSKGVLTVVNTTWNGKTVNVSYTHDTETATSTALESAYGEISGISTTWLAIIVVVLIAAIVLGVLMTQMGSRKA